MKNGSEEVSLNLRRHTAAVVGYRQQNVAAGLDLEMGVDKRLIQFDVFRFDREPASLRHRVAGIDGEVHQNLAHLIRDRP